MSQTSNNTAGEKTFHKSPDDEVNVYEYIDLIKKWWKLFTAIAIVILITGILLTVFAEKTYRAKASFFFPFSAAPSDLSSLLGDSGIVNLLGMENKVDVSDYAISILRSRTVTDTILDKYGPKLFPKNFETKKRTQLRIAMLGIVEIKKTKADTIEIIVITTDKKLSADVANEYLKEYEKFSVNSRLSFAKRNVDFAEKQKDDARKALLKLEKDLKDYQESHDVVDVEEETKEFIKLYSHFRTLSMTADVEYSQALEILEAMRRKLVQEAKFTKNSLDYTDYLKDSFITSYYNELTAKQLQYMQDREKLTDKHPHIQKLKIEIAELKKTIRKRITKRLESINMNLTPDLIDAEIRVVSYRSRRDALREYVSNLNKRMESYPELSMNYVRLSRDIEVYSQIFTYWEMEYQKAIVEERKDPTDYEILDRAIPPDHKHAPVYRINAAVTLLASFMLAFGAVLLAEALSRHKKYLKLK